MPPAEPRQSTVLISTPQQWEAASSPVRIEIIEVMRSVAPCSVAELARALDRPADALYHHLRKLREAGLVRQVESRRVGKQTEAVLDLVAERMAFDHDVQTGRNVHLYVRVASALLTIVERGYFGALRRAGLELHGPQKDVWGRVEMAWLGPEQLARVNEHLNAVVAIMAEGRARPSGRLMYFLPFVFPATRRRGAGWRAERAAAESGPVGTNGSDAQPGPPERPARSSGRKASAPERAEGKRPRKGQSGGG